MDLTKLLPCPFCGHPAQKESGFLPLESIEYVFCSNIDCMLHSVDIGFEESDWNTRTVQQDRWKESLIERCIRAGISFNEEDPESTLTELIKWEVTIATDPRVNTAP